MNGYLSSFYLPQSWPTPGGCVKGCSPAMHTLPRPTLYDTTLRDGTQGEGINFSVLDKLRIAEKLDAFGMHYIEGGWPGSNPKDAAFFEAAKERHLPPRKARRLRQHAPRKFAGGK